jgi:hypothetical protein
VRITIDIDAKTYANMMREAVYYRITEPEEFIETKLEELYG